MRCLDKDSSSQAVRCRWQRKELCVALPATEAVECADDMPVGQGGAPIFAAPYRHKDGFRVIAYEPYICTLS